MYRKVLCFSLLSFFIVSFSCKKKVDGKIHRKGIVNFSSGSVHIIENNNKREASVGSVLKQEMKIVTGDNSIADIYFDENVIRILSNSSVEIKKLIFDIDKNGEHTEIYIFNGRIFSKIKKKLMKDDSYVVKSPSSVAGVRGTEFLVSEENGKGAVSVMEGKVEVQSPGTDGDGPLMINEGQEVKLEEGKKTIVGQLSVETKGELNAIRKNIKDAREDIRNQFKDERERIRNEIKEHKEEVRKMVKDQKDDIKREIKEIKNDMKESREQFKDSKEEIDKIKESVKEFKDEAKKDNEEMRGEAKKRKEEMKDEAKKMKDDLKADMDSLKPKLDEDEGKE